MPSHHPSDRTPLGIAQKMFIQRLLAEHCWTEAQAERVYQECDQDDDDDDVPPLRRSSSTQSPALVDWIKWCNSHLSDFGLEIVSVTLPDSYCDHPQEEPGRPHSRRSTSSAGTTGTSSSSSNTKYYTMVNQFPDAITKDVYQNYLFQPPSLQSYVKRVLSHLAQSYPQPAARATLLNLKHHHPSAVPPPHRPDDDQKDPTLSSSSSQQQQPKVTLTLAEDMLERLLDEQWLRPVVVVHGDASQPSSRGGGGGKIGLGPRAWGELSYFLTLLSPTDQDDNDDDDAQRRRRLWPQPIYIRY